MKVEVIDIQHQLLGHYLQPFLFLSSTGIMPHAYTTFPNSNLCLSLYRDNNINYTHAGGQNLCEVSKGCSTYQSRLYGFHTQPFNARVDAPLDQICILFHPGAIRAFTDIPFEELMAAENAFDILFPVHAQSILDRVFSSPINSVRAAILEEFLLSRLSDLSFSPTVSSAINEMTGKSADLLKLDDFSQRCGVNPSTLYRLFMAEIGQSPKSFFNTIRFRNALKYVLARDEASFTHIAYRHAFHDQPHFNKEMRRLSGYNPAQLRKVASVEQDCLAWVAG
ncbi:helix-turn-helix domain-containing protein [Pedobacter sp. PWIIR3]